MSTANCKTGSSAIVCISASGADLAKINGKVGKVWSKDLIDSRRQCGIISTADVTEIGINKVTTKWISQHNLIFKLLSIYALKVHFVKALCKMQ